MFLMFNFKTQYDKLDVDYATFVFYIFVIPGGSL